MQFFNMFIGACTKETTQKNFFLGVLINLLFFFMNGHQIDLCSTSFGRCFGCGMFSKVWRLLDFSMMFYKQGFAVDRMFSCIKLCAVKYVQYMPEVQTYN